VTLPENETQPAPEQPQVPEPVVAEPAPAQEAVVFSPEELYAPPAPAESAPTVTELEGGNVLVSYYQDGQRYAAVGATEADARNLLADDPYFCRVP
jgi:hypothetical protein